MYDDYRVSRQSSFSRTLANEEKAGYYPTDTAHCREIGKFLKFPEEGEVLCLEPSIGDGGAILAVTEKKDGDNLHILGAELAEDRARIAREKEGIEDVICGDFLKGVTISPSCFTFCFSNPPYETGEDGIRLEAKFLERITPLMKAGGILVYVIPENQFLETGLFMKLWNRFEFLHVFRFHPGEYAKYHQIVLIGRKKKLRSNLLKEERDKLIANYKASIVELPNDYSGEKVEVPASDLTALHEFRATQFPAAEVAQAIRKEGTATNGAVGQFLNDMADRIFVKPWDDGNCDRPPIHPNKDSMYLLGVCGKGQGKCGSEEEGNLHLQRGTVKMVEDLTLNPAEGGDKKGTITAVTRAQVTYKVIESNGTITELV